MDSLTQIALGAAVGEATLGRRVGNKAIVWGAVFGTLPDLDVLANPFLSPVEELAFHRGPTHSFVFAVLAAPVCGWLLARLHRNEPARTRSWALLVFLTLVTHMLLDAFTTYGTQLFWPFSDYPVSFSAIFIIDPLYTLPLLVGVTIALTRARAHPVRRVANWAGLGLSTAYLIFAVGAKLHVNEVVEDALAKQNVPYQRYMTTPAPFNTVLWMVLADDGQSLWVGLYSLLDETEEIRFRRVEKHAARIAHLRDQRALQRLLWFSRGYFTVSHDGDHRVFHDLRFGRSDAWLTERGSYIFSFDLLPNPDPLASPDRRYTFRLHNASVESPGEALRLLWRRMLGVDDVIE